MPEECQVRASWEQVKRAIDGAPKRLGMWLQGDESWRYLEFFWETS